MFQQIWVLSEHDPCLCDLIGTKLNQVKNGNIVYIWNNLTVRYMSRTALFFRTFIHLNDCIWTSAMFSCLAYCIVLYSIENRSILQVVCTNYLRALLPIIWALPLAWLGGRLLGLLCQLFIVLITCITILVSQMILLLLCYLWCLAMVNGIGALILFFFGSGHASMNLFLL